MVSETSLGGVVSIAEDGKSLLYELPDGQFGVDTFVYIVDERYPARVVIEIPNPLESDQYEIIQNGPLEILDVTRNDPFWTGYSGPRQITHVMDVSEGAEVTISDGRFVVYRPPADFYGWDSFRYVVDNAFETYVSVVVQRPVRDDYHSVDMNSVDARLDLTGNDQYWSGQIDGYRDIVDRVTSVGPAESGAVVTITEDGHGVLYSPPQGFIGSDTFEYRADGKYPATVTVNVTKPVRDDFVNVFQDTRDNPLSVLENDFFGNGYTGSRQITEVRETSAGGTVSISAGAGAVLYSPPADFLGPDSFEYVVDGELTANVQVWVQPIVANDYFTFGEPRTIQLDVLKNDHFFDGGYPGPGVITATSDTSGGGSVTISEDGKSLRYSPGQGQDSFRYTVDGKYEATVNISYPQRLSGDSYVVDQNSGQAEYDVLQNDFNSDWIQRQWGRYSGPRVITAVGAAEQGGTVTISGDGKSISYEPAEDFYGDDRFTYTVDGYLTAMVDFHVVRRVRDDQFHVDPGSADNVLTVLVNDLFGADYRGTGRITDVTATSAGGQVTIDDAGETISYTPPEGFSGEDTFTYTVDGQLKAEATVSVHTTASDRFPQFGSLAELKQYLLQSALQQYDSLFGQESYGPIDPVFFERDGVGTGLETVGGDAAPRDHSETNVQVEGVDEADIIETDGDFLYVLTGGELVIARAWPADQLEVASRVAIEGTHVGEYLHGNRLTVVSRKFEEFPWPYPEDYVTDGVDVGLPFADDVIDFRFAPFPYRQEVKTIVTVLDVTDRESPKVVQKTELDGAYVESRRIDDFVYVVVNSGDFGLPVPEVSCDEAEQNCRFESRDAYIARVEANFESLLEEATPQYSSFGPDGELVRKGALVQPEDIFKPLSENGRNLISVVSIDASNTAPGLASTAGVLTTGATTVYGSLGSLYVFEQHYDWTAEDKTTTRILKFDWNGGAGTVDFVASGDVPGYMLNQFAADEFDGHLRVATTVSNNYSGNYSGRDENTLFVLRDDAGVLEYVGSMQNLALNEQIRSVRFFGERAFLVTFRTIDPLFGVDLSDHANPRAVGHLTLPGFSSYMQFIADDRLLTVGENTSGQGSGAVSVSLFNVENLLQPVLIDQYTLPRFSFSEANIDHHAFGWFGPHDVLAVPSARWYWERVDLDGDGYRETKRPVEEHDLYAFRIDATENVRSDDGIQLLGQVTHDSPVRRSAYIEDKLFTFADASIKAVEITDPSQLVGEVVIRSTDVEPPPEPLPLVAEQLRRLDEFRSIAKADLAAYLSVDESSVMTVASETSAASAEDFRLVLRAGELHFVYDTHGDDQVTLDSVDFQFVDTGQSYDWHNEDNPLDTNRDGLVTPIDALLAINHLNHNGSRPLALSSVVRQIARAATGAIDVTGDGIASPIDALTIINWLNGKAATYHGRLGGGWACVLGCFPRGAVFSGRFAKRARFK